MIFVSTKQELQVIEAIHKTNKSSLLSLVIKGDGDVG